MPIIGRLIGRVDSRYLLSFGMLTNAYALLLMSHFSLEVDFWTIIWTRIVQGIGISFFFVPLSTLTLSNIPKPELGNGTAIFNLLRNLGGSFGVAFITTVLSRRTQFHQLHLSEGFSIFDFRLQQAVPNIQTYLQGRGLEGTTAQQGSLGILYGQLQRQAAMLGFNDVFYLLFLFFLCLVPLIWVIRKSATVSVEKGF
jgi:DHA2 family multidrug resistance protein